MAKYFLPVATERPRHIHVTTEGPRAVTNQPTNQPTERPRHIYVTTEKPRATNQPTNERTNERTNQQIRTIHLLLYDYSILY